MLTNSDLIELTKFRRGLHKRPQISGEERETAYRIVAQLTAFSSSRLLTSLGGHGVAAVFEGARNGAPVLFRAELDGRAG